MQLDHPLIDEAIERAVQSSPMAIRLLLDSVQSAGDEPTTYQQSVIAVNAKVFTNIVAEELAAIQNA